MVEETVKAPALGISIQVAAGPGVQIVFQTHVDQETPLPELNKLVDGYMRAADRQRAKADLLELERALKTQEDTLRYQREDRARIEAMTPPVDANRRLPKPVEEKNKVQRAQADANDKRLTDIIAGMREQIEATKAIIAKDD